MGANAICVVALIACMCGCSQEDPQEAEPAGNMVLDLGGGVTMKLVEMPAGKFVMGSPTSETGRGDDEGPLRGVTISKPFHMGIYEVTQNQYDIVMGIDNNPSRYQGAAKPVESVTWEEAMEFCRKASAKTGKTITLPTEAQWEYACRSGSKTRYCFGDDEKQLRDYARYGRGDAKGSDAGAAAVGLKKPNRWGLYDMHGNVSEWCSDWHARSYVNAPSKDPTGPGSGEGRVIRGGSWCDSAANCRSAFRGGVKPVGRYGSSLGFRIVVIGEGGTAEEKGVAGESDEAPSAATAVPSDRTMELAVAEGVAMRLVQVPAGKFLMGSPNDEAGHHVSEGPQREVTISRPFHMGIHEVTQDQYEAVMGENLSRFRGAERPVENVTWNDAAEFCRKVSQRTGKRVTLPSEAQWEYACRAGSQTRYYFGDDEKQLGEHAICGRDSDVGTDKVGRKKPNGWGLYDMYGNVWEWCLDWHAMTYEDAASTDPTGPESGEKRVLRGGSWAGRPENIRSAVRNWHSPAHCDMLCGFRIVVLDAGEKTVAASSSDAGGISAISPSEQIWVKCNNPACKAEYQMGKKAFYQFMMENVNPLAKSEPPMECETCAKKSVYRAEKCEKCGKVFFLNAAGPADFADRCPHCKYSAEEEKRKRRMSGQF